VILKPSIDTFDQLDETPFHYNTILVFREQFPNLDLVGYRSATAPLYHIFMAMTSFVIGADLVVLRGVNLLLSSICLGIVSYSFCRFGGARRGLAFSLPFALSPYFVGCAVRISTDNAALLFAILACLMLDSEPKRFSRSLLANTYVSVAIGIRQIYAFFIGVYVMWRIQCLRKASSFSQFARAIFPVLLPIALLAIFVWLWGGITPPQGRARLTQLNFDAPVYIVSLAGVYCVFLLPWLFLKLRERTKVAMAVIVAVPLCLGVLMLHPVSSDYDRGVRGGMLWALSQHVPEVFGTSWVFVVLFPFGGCAIVLLVDYLYRQERFVLICLALWLFTYTFNGVTYQKYYEPFLLFCLTYVAVKMDAPRFPSTLGAYILSCLFLLIDISRFF
jgi:hypothetical protein